MNDEKSHRNCLYVLTFAEFWDRFSYYGIQALLVLYMTKALLFTDSQAYGLYGTFTALSFATTVLGGMLADRLLGIQRSVVLGAILMMTANILLILPGKQLMYLGLSVLVCGIGLFKPNNASFVGELYKKTDTKREGAFSIFYVGMNAGALLGPLVYGYIAHNFGWLYGFGISAIGMLSALIILFMTKLQLIEKPEQSYTKILGKPLPIGISTRQSIYISILIAIGLFYILLQHAEFFGKLLIFIGLATITGLTIIAVKSNKTDRERIIGLSLLAFFCIFFFACSLQTATTLTLFIERDINRNILGFHLPTMVFLSLQPFFIILTAPLVANIWAYLGRKNCDLKFSTKIAIGLVMAAISFTIFSLASRYNHNQGHLPLFLVVLGNLLLGLGELCVIPVVLSAISQLAPMKIRSTMMGILFLALAFSGYLAGAIAKIISVDNLIGKSQHAVDYAHAFIEVAMVTLAMSAFMFIINPMLKRMLFRC